MSAHSNKNKAPLNPRMCSPVFVHRSHLSHQADAFLVFLAPALLLALANLTQHRLDLIFRHGLLLLLVWFAVLPVLLVLILLVLILVFFLILIFLVFFLLILFLLIFLLLVFFLFVLL